MLENSEMEKILEKLEALDDEKLSVKLLKDFSEATSVLGRLLLNLDESLESSEWKLMCEQAQKKVDTIVAKIMSL